MTDIEEFDQQIEVEMAKFTHQVNSLKDKDYQQRLTQFPKITQLQKNVSRLLEAYELEISNLPNNKKEPYESALHRHQQRFRTMRTQFAAEKNQHQNPLIDPSKDILKQDMDQMGRQEMVDYGHALQDKGLSKLDDIIVRIDEGQKLANDIDLELDRQIQALDRAHAKAKDTQSTLKRTKALLRYFGRQIQTDKMLMGCIFLIVVAVVTLIILSATGTLKDSKVKV